MKLVLIRRTRRSVPTLRIKDLADMPSPGGQVSEMARSDSVAAAGLVLFGISSTSTRVTTRHPGRTLGRIGRRWA